MDSLLRQPGGTTENFRCDDRLPDRRPRAHNPKVAGSNPAPATPEVSKLCRLSRWWGFGVSGWGGGRVGPRSLPVARWSRPTPYIRESILEPGRGLVAAYAGIMPSYRRLLDQDEVESLLSWIRPRNDACQGKRQPVRTAVESVCGMEVDAGPGTPSASADGCTEYICSEKCRDSFRAAPRQLVARSLPAAGASLPDRHVSLATGDARFLGQVGVAGPRPGVILAHFAAASMTLATSFG